MIDLWKRKVVVIGEIEDIRGEFSDCRNDIEDVKASIEVNTEFWTSEEEEALIIKRAIEHFEAFVKNYNHRIKRIEIGWWEA